MELKKNKFAKLPGWYGPYYPPQAARLAEVWGGSRHAMLAAAMQGIAGLVQVQDIITSDAYRWRGVVLSAHRGNVLVALPQKGDDRLPAVYVDAEALLQQDVWDAAVARVARALLGGPTPPDPRGR